MGWIVMDRVGQSFPIRFRFESLLRRSCCALLRLVQAVEDSLQDFKLAKLVWAHVEIPENLCSLKHVETDQLIGRQRFRTGYGHSGCRMM